MEKIRIGIIGTGGIAHAHARAYKNFSDVEVVAGADIVPGKARAFLDEFGWTDAAAYETCEALCARDDIDAVSVCTYNSQHAACAVPALLSGKHVLLVDTDMRKSVIVQEYSVKNANHKQILGLSYYLSGQNKLDEVLYRTNLPHVDIVFAGRSVPNPTEILGKKYFTDLLAYGRENYDYVLIDCAPVTAAIDAVLVAHYCDGAVLVIAQGDASSRAVLDAKQQLENSGVRILGAVLNKVRMEGSRYGHYYGKYYGNYYGKYYGHYETSDDNGGAGSAGGKKKDGGGTAEGEAQ